MDKPKCFDIWKTKMGRLVWIFNQEYPIMNMIWWDSISNTWENSLIRDRLEIRIAENTCIEQYTEMIKKKEIKTNVDTNT